MLLPREQSPWNCGYVLGAYALEALRGGAADISELQTRMTKVSGRKISPTQVVAAASWLYLLDAVRLNAEGRLEKCV